MCGIIGIFSLEGSPPFRDLWPDLVNHLRHRGPDEGAWWSDGSFFFGHRRLSIIDLTSGDQPMATQDGELVITFNGEIYNFIELRSELEKKGYQFTTKSDTEVLLYGYREWHEGLPLKLIGQFAFAIADRCKNELFLARDRFGEKPLFILRTQRYVAFASEIKPLAALPDLDKELDIVALGGYLCLNYIPGNNTLFKHINRIAPASWQIHTQTGVRSDSYWSLSEKLRNNIPEKKVSLNDAVSKFQYYLDHAVKFCLRSDVPVGILLSGGIDSSLIAESAMRQGNLNQAYFIDFEEQSYSEFSKAEEVTKRLGLPLKRILLTPKSLTETFFKIVDHADDPLADSSTFPVWVLTEEAARGNKVVLGGDGGDEVFAGYLTYLATLAHDRVITHLPMVIRGILSQIGSNLHTTEGKVTFSYKLRRFLRAALLPTSQAHFTWNGTWLPDEMIAFILPGLGHDLIWQTISNVVQIPKICNNYQLKDLQLVDIKEYLPNDILAKTDRMSMAHGLEVRAPFLEYELVEWALRQPDHLKIYRRNLKAIPRAAAYKIYGKSIANSPKQGFSIPVHQWIRGPMAEIIRDLLSPASITQIGILDSKHISKVVADHFSGNRSYGFELWGLAVLMAWFRLRVDQAPKPPDKSQLIRRHFLGDRSE
jgi:asparagine synthase (glutamine-hydrolysing)